MEHLESPVTVYDMNEKPLTPVLIGEEWFYLLAVSDRALELLRQCRHRERKRQHT